MTSLENHRLDGSTLSAGCSTCPLLDICGGYTRNAGGWNCMDNCSACDPATCKKVCLRSEGFPHDLREIGGFEVGGNFALHSGHLLDAPTFIPTIQHQYKRVEELNAPWVALPMSSVFHRVDGGYGPVASNAAELRAVFRLSPEVRILILGTGKDRHIEPYWRWRRKHEAPKRLSELDVDGVIVPNFSFELSDPRPHHLHSRKRSIICARELAESSVATMLVLQAVTEADWLFWETFLSEHPEVRAVAKDFQTGLVKPERGRAAIARLATLQDRLRRPLHLFAIGGPQYSKVLAQAFDHWTIIGSTPFIKAMNRQVALSDVTERRVRFAAAPDEPPELLLEHNILTFERWIAEQSQSGDVLTYTN